MVRVLELGFRADLVEGVVEDAHVLEDERERRDARGVHRAHLLQGQGFRLQGLALTCTINQF